MIAPEDVYSVAQDLGLNPTPDQVQEVLDNYEAAVKQDPGATWDLIVEQLLDQILEED